MKLVFCDGRRLEVRDVSDPLIIIEADEVPLKCFNRIMSDDAARAAVRMFLNTGLYRRVK